MAVKMWRIGRCSQSEIARAFGVTRTSVSRWAGAVQAGNVRALQARRRPGRLARLGRLLDCGERCGIHRIARLMRAARLAARRKRRRSPQDSGA